MAQGNSVFDFSTYKAFLSARIGSKGQRNGQRSALAKALGCQSTYISQILNGSADFSLEQAYKVTEFLGLTVEESHFFLLLLQRERAGSKALKDYFETQIQESLSRRMILTERLGKRTQLSSEHQGKYYSSWIFAAVHMALTVPELRNLNSIGKFLGLPLKKVSEAINFLLEAGLAEDSKDGYRTSQTKIRLGNDSFNIIRHHANWRTKVLQSLDREEITDLHYSSVFSVSEADKQKIKDLLMNTIQKNSEIVGPSREEDLCALCLDFFSIRMD